MITESHDGVPGAGAFAGASPDLLRALDNYAPEAYDPTGVTRGIGLLREAGLVASAAQPAYQAEGHPSAEEAATAFGRQLSLLYAVGRGSLPLGRIFEGHVNALELVHRLGTPPQRARYRREAQAGHLFGVWNTEAADGVHLRGDAGTGPGGALRVEGAKTFCSGALAVTRPVVSGQLWRDGRARGWQLYVAETEALGPDVVDDAFWTPLGMQASASHRVDFTGTTVLPASLLGAPDAYHAQPHFSGGAVRFAAVQLGGAHALYDHVRAFLRRLRRERDPYQVHRLGRMAIALQGGRNWLRVARERALCAWGDPEEVVDYANMTRTAILEACERVLAETEMAVGARGLLQPPAIQRIYADLKMYLRQPAPDGALASVGHRAADDQGLVIDSVTA